MIQDHKIDPAAMASKHYFPFPAVVAASQTDRAFAHLVPGHSFELRELRASAVGVTAAITFDAVIVPPTAVIRAGALTVHSTPEQLALALSRYIVGGKVVEKAAASGITFSAAHVVTATKFGAILVQIDNTGAVTTKVGEATQTTAMAYDTAQEAINALPAADAGKLAIAYIVIEADAGDWTANTDDLTNGSDLTSATITMIAAQARVLSSALTPVAGEEVLGTRSTDRARVRGSKTDHLLLLYTTDGTGALVNGIVTAVLQARPGGGQSSAE